MKRSIALLAGVAVVFVVAARPVAAAPGTPETSTSTPTSSVPADAIGLSLSKVPGAGLAVTLDAGASEEHDLVVSNHTANLRLTIKLTATDATGNLGLAAASWLAFGDDAIQLDPHVAATVPMTIAVPHDTQPGSALAHVNATVESAVAAADGSPIAGTASGTFPVSVSVRGTPTAQIAIADVHRVDQGSRHQLAVVVRNFGDQGAKVDGHVRVAGDHPQLLPFHADLGARRDTTVDLEWNAPPVGAASDIAVDLEYGGGNVATWSSRLGGAPTDLSPLAGGATPTPTTTPVASATSPNASAGTAAPSKPWWKRPYVTVLAILALLGAALWFAFEMRASRRRPRWVAPVAGHDGVPPGWVAASSEQSVELVKQIVRLTDVIVQLVAVHRDEREISDQRPRARSPDPAPADAPIGSPPRSRFEGDELRYARAGPAPPEPGLSAEPTLSTTEQPEVIRSASPTPGAVARPEPGAGVVAGAIGNDEVDDPRAAMMERLMDLDRQRRRLRDWMDAEEAEEMLEPPPLNS